MAANDGERKAERFAPCTTLASPTATSSFVWRQKRTVARNSRLKPRLAAVVDARGGIRCPRTVWQARVGARSALRRRVRQRAAPRRSVHVARKARRPRAGTALGGPLG